MLRKKKKKKNLLYEPQELNTKRDIGNLRLGHTFIWRRTDRRFLNWPSNNYKNNSVAAGHCNIKFIPYQSNAFH